MPPNTPAAHQKIASGKSVVNRHEKSFKRGTLMFIEGETSTEMYIIKNGKVRILKQEGESTVELAVLGAGSVLGELALLDHQPRTATAQVVEETSAVVIDEGLFRKTLATIPSWLNTIVMEVVKRLRVTMKRASDDVVQRSIAGVIRVITLLAAAESSGKDGMRSISLSRAKELIYATIGLGAIESEDVFLHLILKDMILIRKNDVGQEFLLFKDEDVLSLYMNFLRAKQHGSGMTGEDFSEKAVEVLAAIISAGEKSGRKIQAGLVALSLAQLDLEIERLSQGRTVAPDALDELLRVKIVIRQEEAADMKYGTRGRILLVFNPETLKRVRLLVQWLPVFREEVRL